jgi:hypothetical protein
MAVQTTYSTNMAAAFEGQIADMYPNEIVSRRVETAAGIAPGRVVSRGTNDNQVTIGGDATGFGITVRDLANEGAYSTNELSYAQYDVCPVLRKGYCYVDLQNTGAKGATLFYNDTTGLISAGTAGAGETQLDGCTLEQAVASAGIALIRVAIEEPLS